jgi:hypothetical protein
MHALADFAREVDLFCQQFMSATADSPREVLVALREMGSLCDLILKKGENMRNNRENHSKYKNNANNSR